MTQLSAETRSEAPGSESPTHPLIESDRVEGTEVYGVDDQHIGWIKRLMIDKKSGQVAYAVMGFGGFLGLGEEDYTVPWSKLDYNTSLGGYKTDLTADQLKGAPDFYKNDDYKWQDRDKERELHSYYGVTPYWGL
ncbi:PRC-barrel domain-containing protein [Enterovirga sp.]|mgnify:CR=1 FL=1|uniref:PRC-barrel domain-containing protein n=1 Tax=Enterovirga sp. TaxID=2026350 RepID=UPI002BE8404A|nr:PRC-barrel domain-containing protein [Enterovirga sp.]HMO29424.1 PRC-barrel domain-containing protein [Enterovirga sp.]